MAVAGARATVPAPAVLVPPSENAWTCALHAPHTIEVSGHVNASQNSLVYTSHVGASRLASVAEHSQRASLLSLSSRPTITSSHAKFPPPSAPLDLSELHVSLSSSYAPTQLRPTEAQ